MKCVRELWHFETHKKIATKITGKVMRRFFFRAPFEGDFEHCALLVVAQKIMHIITGWNISLLRSQEMYRIIYQLHKI